MNISFYPRIIAILLILVAVFYALYEFERWRVLNRQQNILDLQVHDVERQFTQFSVLSKMLAIDPRLVDVLEDENTTTIATANKLLLHAVDVSDATIAFVMNGEGTTLAASNFAQNISFIGQNYAFRPYFIGAIEGAETTFFAVGATTGIPGYFTASPVFVDNRVIGVVVIKIESEELPSLWRDDDSSAMVTDEFGVVLLSANADFLYTPTRRLETAEQVAIAEQRRYPVAENRRFEQPGFDRWHLNNTGGNTQKFLSVSKSLVVEPWRVSLLKPMGQVYWRVLEYFLTLLALLVIVGLIWRLFRQQRQLASVREREARELEQLVGDRTRELENAQQALIAESNFAMLGKMSAAINHEVNQPLASLRLNLASLRGVLESNVSSTEDIHEIVVDCDRTTKRISRVIETLRSVARKTSSGIVRLNVNQLVADVETTIRRERPQMSLCLSIRCDPVATEFHGNEVLLQQALLNLLYNAFDAVLSVEDPQVILTVHDHSAEQPVLVFEVSDNGAGVPAAMEAHMFKPFESDADKSTGMGLGLALAGQIARDHGGTLHYEPGEITGSRFALRLPGVPLHTEKHSIVQ